MRRGWMNAVLLLSGLGVGFACAEATGKDSSSPPEQVAPSSPLQPTTEYNPVNSLAPLVERVQMAVVNIDVEQKVEVPTMSFQSPFGPFFQDPHGFGQQGPGQGDDEDEHHYRTQEGAGSGFLISTDGYILTNNHVVADADKVKVRLADDRSFDARVIGTDERTDVAVVKIDAKVDLPFVKLGSSDALRVGDWVVAIGNPYGLAHTVTAGIVSAKGRAIGAGPYDDFIQTDASINPGNSGGPLFNLAGEVVGINSAIVRSANSIGFAIPTSMVQPILEELKSTGRVARGWMGMGLQELDPDLAKALGVDPKLTGAVVSQVYPGLPAAEAGLKSSDVIVGLDDKPVKSSDELVRSIGMRRPGETVKLSLIREGKERSLSVKLGERPDEEALARGEYNAPKESGEKAESKSAAKAGSPLQRLGLTLEDASRYNLGADGGLVVTRVADDSVANGKLMQGDVIVAVNQRDVRTVDDVNKALSSAGDVALFSVKRKNGQRLVAVPLK